MSKKPSAKIAATRGGKSFVINKIASIASCKKANYMTGNSESHNYLLGENVMNETDNQQKRFMDIGYLIAIIDGEGCFSLQKTSGWKGKRYPSCSPLVQVTNTNPLIILKTARIIKEFGLACRVYLQKQSGHKLCYRVVVLGMKRVQKFLDFIMPYMECRVDQASTLQKYVDSRLSKGIREPYNEYEQHLSDTLARLNRPYLFSETVRMPQDIAEKIQSELTGNSKAAQWFKQQYFSDEKVETT